MTFRFVSLWSQRDYVLIGQLGHVTNDANVVAMSNMSKTW